MHLNELFHLLLQPPLLDGGRLGDLVRRQQDMVGIDVLIMEASDKGAHAKIARKLAMQGPAADAEVLHAEAQLQEMAKGDAAGLGAEWDAAHRGHGLGARL